MNEEEAARQEQEKQAERTKAYIAMAQMWAWKDFMQVLEGMKALLISDFVTSITNESDAILKGRLQQIEAIKQEIGFLTSEK